MVSAWRNFKNIFSRPLFTIIFRPEMLFQTYSVLTGDTMVGFVIFCVLILGATYNLQQCLSHQKVRAETPILNGIYFEKNIHRWCQEMVVLPAKNSFLAQLSIFMVRKENTLLFLTFDLGSWLAGMYLVKCQPLCKSVWHIGTYI